MLIIFFAELTDSDLRWKGPSPDAFLVQVQYGGSFYGFVGVPQEVVSLVSCVL